MQSFVEPCSPCEPSMPSRLPSPVEIAEHEAQPLRGVLYSAPIAIMLWSILLAPLLLR